LGSEKNLEVLLNEPLCKLKQEDVAAAVGSGPDGAVDLAVDACNDKGSTALLRAVNQGHEEVAEALLGANADVSLANQASFNPQCHPIEPPCNPGLPPN